MFTEEEICKLKDFGKLISNDKTIFLNESNSKEKYIKTSDYSIFENNSCFIIIGIDMIFKRISAIKYFFDFDKFENIDNFIDFIKQDFFHNKLKGDK